MVLEKSIFHLYVGFGVWVRVIGKGYMYVKELSLQSDFSQLTQYVLEIKKWTGQKNCLLLAM